MAKKPTYEELEQRVKELENETVERKRAEEALRESEVKYHNIFNNAQAGIFRTRISDGKVLECNDRFARTFGYKTPEECIDDFVVSERYTDPGAREKMVASFMEKGKVRNREACFSRKDGDDVWVRFSARAYPEEGYLEGVGYDITEEKRALEAMQKSEAQKKAILDASIDVIRLVDKDMKIIWANKTTTTELKAAPEHLEGSFCYEAVAGRDTPCPGCPTKKAFKSGKTENALVHQKELEGIKGETDWDYYAVPIKNESGDIVNLIQISRNITDHKLTEEALRESEEKYRNLVEESFDGIFIQRGQSIIFANKRLNEMLGYREGELIGQNHWVVYHPDYQKLTRARAQARMRGEEVLRRYEVKLQRKDGSWFYGEVNARPITFPSDEESGIQVWVKDIDERKQAEEALQESEEHLRSFMESAKGFIVYRLEVDPENYFSGRLVFVSPGIEDEIGISPEAEFSEWFNNIHPDDLPGLIEAQAKSVRNRDTFDQEFRWKNMKGEWGWCHAISNPVFDSDGNPAYYNGLIVNLTAQKQAEKFRFISSTLLTAQEREKKRISLDLHDELGQSLVVLKLQLRSIQRRLEEGQTELRSDCQAMLDYIVGLIENIRRICMDLTPGILDDLGLTAGIRWLVENALKTHDIDTSLDIANIDKLLTNEQQLLVFRIFQEAFTNIVRHSCASLTSIVIKKRGGEISFVIEDNGKGFDVKETMSIDFTERGMGLSAIEERAWMLGGSVNIRSERELGTRIAFQVPHRVNPNVA